MIFIYKRVKVPLGFNYQDAVDRLGHLIDVAETQLIPCDDCYVPDGVEHLNDDDFLAVCCLDRLIRGEIAYQKFEELTFQEYKVEGEDYEIQIIPIIFDSDFQPTKRSSLS